MQPSDDSELSLVAHEVWKHSDELERQDHADEVDPRHLPYSIAPYSQDSDRFWTDPLREKAIVITSSGRFL